jgi:hypothetical protein
MRTKLPPRADGRVRSTALLTCACMLVLGLAMRRASAKSIPHPHRQPREVVHTIERLESQWQRAELSANTAVMASMLSDDYLGIYGDGTLATKAETLAAVRSGKIHFSAVNVFDVKIRVFGTTAVVVSKAQVSGVKDGEDVSGLYRYTRVYHRINGVWKIVSFEASTVRHHHHAHRPHQ